MTLSLASMSTSHPAPKKVDEENPKKATPSLSPRATQFDRHRHDIFKLISQEMTIKKFLFLTRAKEMRIPAFEMQNVQLKYPSNIESQIYAILQVAERANDKNEFPDILLKSLIDAGNYGLKRTIEEKYLPIELSDSNGSP